MPRRKVTCEVTHQEAPGATIVLRDEPTTYALQLFGFTCGNRKPIVAKQPGCPIHLRLTWENGKAVENDVPPGGRAFLSDPPHHPRQVVISLPNGES